MSPLKPLKSQTPTTEGEDQPLAPLTPINKAPISFVDETDVWLKALIYAPGGAGKTYLACTLPNVLFLITENNVSKMTILRAQKDLGIKIPKWEVETAAELEKAWVYLRTGGHGFESVVVDSLSDINIMKGFELIHQGVTNPKRDHDPDMLEVDDYNRLTTWTRRMVRSFRDLDMHVVMTARIHEAERLGVKTKTGDVPQTTVMPELYPKAVRCGISGMFNCVGYLGIAEDAGTRESYRALVFGPSPRYVTKSPGGYFDDIEARPNLANLIQKLPGRKEETEDA